MEPLRNEETASSRLSLVAILHVYWRTPILWEQSPVTIGKICGNCPSITMFGGKGVLPVVSVPVVQGAEDACRLQAIPEGHEFF